MRGIVSGGGKIVIISHEPYTLCLFFREGDRGQFYQGLEKVPITSNSTKRRLAYVLRCGSVSVLEAVLLFLYIEHGAKLIHGPCRGLGTIRRWDGCRGVRNLCDDAALFYGTAFNFFMQLPYLASLLDLFDDLMYLLQSTE